VVAGRRWPFVSNCQHVEWIGLCARVVRRNGDVEPAPRLVFIRADEVTIEDTWDTAGLQGTGSHHVRVSGVRVPPERGCEFIGVPWAQGPIWRMPVFSAILPPLAACPLGIARGALDELARQVRQGRQGVRRGDLANDPLAMHDIAEAELRLESARAAAHHLGREAHDRVARGERLEPGLLARVYLADIHAAETAVEVTAVAHRLGGGAAAYSDSPLLRGLVDVQTAHQHWQFAHDHRVHLGRVLTGVADTYPPYITERDLVR